MTVFVATNGINIVEDRIINLASQIIVVAISYNIQYLIKMCSFSMMISAVKEDFIDQHAVSSIKEKLPHVMPVSCYRLGIDGANIVFQSKVSAITHYMRRPSR